MAIVGESGVTDNCSVADSSSDMESETQADVPETKVTQEQAEAKSTSRSLLRPPKSLATTMFDRLETMYGGAVKRMLEAQYRMNTKISNFPSKILYHSRLTSHTSNASRLLSHLPGVSQEEEYEDVVGTGREVIFWDTAGASRWWEHARSSVLAELVLWFCTRDRYIQRLSSWKQVSIIFRRFT
ncbi:hypothetical protein JB92DRAFT_1980020 [Gautieria morchelliformis]|nr:hypothetical protein JB92DRAFT_1980020 [Gautieria morchelliformis]